MIPTTRNVDRLCRCGHCKALAPHYEEAATALKEKDIKIAKVDCVDQPELCQVHGVQGYP
jgi:protein disulfide-isomerase A1